MSFARNVPFSVSRASSSDMNATSPNMQDAKAGNAVANTIEKAKAKAVESRAKRARMSTVLVRRESRAVYKS